MQKLPNANAWIYRSTFQVISITGSSAAEVVNVLIEDIYAMVVMISMNIFVFYKIYYC